MVLFWSRQNFMAIEQRWLWDGIFGESRGLGFGIFKTEKSQKNPQVKSPILGMGFKILEAEKSPIKNPPKFPMPGIGIYKPREYPRSPIPKCGAKELTQLKTAKKLPFCQIPGSGVFYPGIFWGCGFFPWLQIYIY